MRTTTDLIETTFKHREWHIVPDKADPDYFTLEEIKTGKVLGRFVLPEGIDPGFLNLIASAPELQDIAEMFRDSMKGNRAEKSMIFSIVCEVLRRSS